MQYKNEKKAESVSIVNIYIRIKGRILRLQQNFLVEEGK